jgi:hypothetical protein
MTKLVERRAAGDGGVCGKSRNGFRVGSLPYLVLCRLNLEPLKLVRLKHTCKVVFEFAPCNRQPREEYHRTGALTASLYKKLESETNFSD